jgi:hypothetical protein
MLTVRREWIAACAVLISAGCGSKSGDGPTGEADGLSCKTGFCDSTPPIASIASPTDGSTVNGGIIVSGTASDNVAVKSIQIQVDNNALELATGTTSWTFSLDTTMYPDGSHTITALVTDTSYNASTAYSNVTFANSVKDLAAPPDQMTISCLQASASWQGQTFVPQSGTFRAVFDATPNGSAIDGVMGLSANVATGYTDLAAIVRFNDAGFIDMRNGASYSADTQIAYVAGVSYQFRMEVNVPLHTYSAFVTPAGGSEVTIGSNYAFRNEQLAVTSLTDWDVFSSVGTSSACNLHVSTTAVTPSPDMAAPSPDMAAPPDLGQSASGHAYTVKAAGGGDYTTIQACADAISPGDTCVVWAGTYNEDVAVPSGTTGNYKTMNVNGSDVVYVHSFTINSHVKLNGFHIQNPANPTNAPCVSLIGNSTDFYITNNNMYACGVYMIKEPWDANTTFGFIQGNTLSYSCSTANAPNVCTAMAISGDHHLIENNDISHVSDGPYLSGKYNVMRTNTFHDLNSSDCGSNSGNCHVDFMQADVNVVGGGMPAQYLLLERNRAINMVGSDMHSVGLFQGEACNGQCFQAIVRFHVSAHIGGGAIVDDNSGANPPAWDNVHAYNNDWIDGDNQDTGNGGGINGWFHGSTGGADLNDIFYFTFAANDFNTYACGDTACTGFQYGHSIAFCTTSPCSIHSHVYGVGNFTDDPGNIQVNPNFVNYAGNDFHLTSGSPAIGAGSNLTTVAGSDSGSGSALVVSDAGYFQDGYGIPGVEGDWIRVGPTATAQILSVNYNTNTLTLANPMSRSPGDPVYLFKDSSGRQVLYGSAPDIGALPFSGP